MTDTDALASFTEFLRQQLSRGNYQHPCDGLPCSTAAYVITGRLLDGPLSDPSVVFELPIVKPLLDVVRAAIRTHPKHCPVFGHWRPWGDLTEADRPERYSDPRTLRSDCADDQCNNPQHISYHRCDHRWHDIDEALAALPSSVREYIEGQS